MLWTTVAFCVLSSVAQFVPAQSEMNSATFQSPPMISEFKMKVHRTLEGSRIRKKRQLGKPGESSDYKLRFESVTPEDLPYLSDFNLTFWIPAAHMHASQVFIGTKQGHLLLFQLSTTDDKRAITVALSEQEDVAVKARAFSYHEEQWFCVLHSSSEGYYIRMYQRVGRGLERRQKIVLMGESDMEVITMKGIHYLVVVTYQAKMSYGTTYKASISLYHWTQTQFDAIASRTTHGARSVACWVMGGSLYFAVGQEVNDEENFKVGSPIFYYNSKGENRLVLWQIINTIGPSKVRHFYVGASHYVIFIGKHDAVIYWWSSGQFLEWQTLAGTASASDLSILTLGDGEVAIVIGLKEEALFFTLDASGYYILTFSMSFKGSYLASLQFMYSGKSYFALALFAGSYGQSIWKLSVAPHYLPSVTSLDPLQQCLADARDLLQVRQQELDAIQSDMKRVWLKGSNQTVAAKVIVTGKMTSINQIDAKDIIIVRQTELPDSSMGLVIDELVATKDSMDDIKTEMEGVVYKSKRQEIHGTKYFSDPVFVPSLTLDFANNDLSINEVSLSRLRNHALRKVGDQVFPNYTIVSNLETKDASIGTLNGISTDDLLLLHGRQVVAGHLAFMDVDSNSLSVDSINSINIEDMVTTTSSQSINDIKMFSRLHSDVIEVRGETNGVNLGDSAKKIATVDKYSEIRGHVTFQRPVTLTGNLFLTGLINKFIDLSRLLSESVTRDSQQDLTGLYKFMRNQVIEGDLLVAGTINGVSIDNLLTLSTNQKVYADMTFSAPLTIKHDLLLDTVNGVDLSENVLRREEPYQFLNGQKIFAQDIAADFVDMTDYITLDSVDPSHLVQDIVQHKQGVVKSNSTAFKDVVVLGNVTAMGGINGFAVTDLSSSVWLKNVDQDITVPLETHYLHFQNDLNVDTVQQYNLDTDLVHSYFDEVIVSPKVFQQKVVTHGFKTAENAKINGINPDSFKVDLERNGNLDTVYGTKILNSLDVDGELIIDQLNGVAPSDIMQMHIPQTIYGPVEFQSEITSISGGMKADDLSFGIFNGINMHDYFRNAVTSRDRAAPVANKDFSHLKATNLTLPHGSTINGIALNELLRRAVTLNTPQFVTSAKELQSASFEKLISVFDLNGLYFSDYINKVVFTDEISKITNKHFSRVNSSNVFIKGTINGINIADMASNVFYKSEDNKILHPFIFTRGLEIGNLLAESTIDGVDWNKVVILKNNEVLGPGWFQSKVNVNGDIFLKGRLNGCDLQELESKTIHKNKHTQVITEHVYVERIIVHGNVNLKNPLNEVSVEEMKGYITTSGDQEITSDVIITANLAVNNLNLKKMAASAKIGEIVRDAARHSLPQIIQGRKVFKDNLEVTLLGGRDVFVSTVDGVDIEELYKSAVWKNGQKEISGDKIFSQLNSSLVTVTGYLNGLKLPEDVVLTDAFDYISHPTFFMSDLFMVSDLVVHGLTDGIDIQGLLSHRVTVNGDENITALLTFYDDVVLHDEMVIDGTINEIVLELAAMVNQVQPLQGYKVFVKLFVSGPVSASSVNGFNVPELSSKILRYNKDDYVNDVQVFEKPVKVANSLFAEWINSVSMRRLTDTFEFLAVHLKNAISFLEDFSFSLQQQLHRQLSSTQDKVSRFAYFVLFQEINMGPTTKILNAYALEHITSEFSHSMVMWTKEKHCMYMETCCHLEFSYWMRVKKDGKVMVDGTPESGRYYPIRDPTAVMYGKDFFIWTNSTDVQPKWCNEKNQRLIFASYTSQGLLEALLDIKGALLLSDVKTFRKDHMFAVTAYFYETVLHEYSTTVVYMYNELTRHWSEHQILSTFGVLSLDIVEYVKGDKDVLLALGCGIESQSLSQSAVYRWNNMKHAFEIVQNIPTSHVTSTLWIMKGRDLLLSMASVDHWPGKHIDCTETVSGGAINIFSYKDRLEWIQSIPVSGVISMATFSVDGDTFLAAASSQHQTIYIFEWKGYSAFVQTQSMFVGEVKHISIYTVGDDTYMTVALTSGPSKILKMVQKGHNSKSNFDSSALESSDESSTKYLKGC